MEQGIVERRGQRAVNGSLQNIGNGQDVSFSPTEFPTQDSRVRLLFLKNIKVGCTQITT